MADWPVAAGTDRICVEDDWVHTLSIRMCRPRTSRFLRSLQVNFWIARRFPKWPSCMSSKKHFFETRRKFYLQSIIDFMNVQGRSWTLTESTNGYAMQYRTGRLVYTPIKRDYKYHLYTLGENLRVVCKQIVLRFIERSSWTLWSTGRSRSHAWLTIKVVVVTPYG